MQTRKQKKVSLAPGIYRDAHGVDVIARIGTRPRLLTARERFPLCDKAGVPYDKKHRNLDELVLCQVRLRAGLRDTPEADRGVGTLAADIETFVATLTKASEKADFPYLLAHWAKSPLGAMRRVEIKRRHVLTQRDAWRDATGDEAVAIVTINHRLRALKALFVGLYDGDDPDEAKFPTDKTYLRVPDGEARGVPMPIVTRIISSMPDRGRPTDGARPTYSETKIRVRVMAWTGLPHKSLMRLERKNVNFREARLFLPARKKGKRPVPGRWVDMLPAAVEALKDYDAANLWGRAFSRSSVHKSWRRAIANTRQALKEHAEQTGDATLLEDFTTAVPEDCRPYDLRHSFLTEAYRRSGDLRAVSELGQHALLETTKRYTKAGVDERVSATVAKMAEGLANMPAPAPLVRGARVRKFPALVAKK